MRPSLPRRSGPSRSSFLGEVMHRRLRPAAHQVPVPRCSSCVSAVQRGRAAEPLFRRQPLEPVRLRRSATMARATARIRSSGSARCSRAKGSRFADGEVWLQAFPRVLGYVFNPVSFWLCHDRAARCARACEVNNTFGERHYYLLAHPDARPIVRRELTARKVFHVSPFFRVGATTASASSPEARACCRASTTTTPTGDLLHTSISGRAAPSRRGTLLGAFCAHPVDDPRGRCAHPLAGAQALGEARAVLLETRAAAAGGHPMSAREQTASRIASSRPARRPRGARVARADRPRPGRGGMPDGSLRALGGGAPVARLDVADWGVFGAALRRGDIGFAEAFIDGRLVLARPRAAADGDRAQSRRDRARGLWRVLGPARLPSPARVQRQHPPRQPAQHRRALRSRQRLLRALARPVDDLLERAVRRATRCSRSQAAQAAKYGRILERLAPRPGDHILEIGCGWGAFAEMAARDFGCRVTGVTLSEEQLAYARGAHASRRGRRPRRHRVPRLSRRPRHL